MCMHKCWSMTHFGCAACEGHCQNLGLEIFSNSYFSSLQWLYFHAGHTVASMHANLSAPSMFPACLNMDASISVGPYTASSMVPAYPNTVASIHVGPYTATSMFPAQPDTVTSMHASLSTPSMFPECPNTDANMSVGLYTVNRMVPAYPKTVASIHVGPYWYVSSATRYSGQWSVTGSINHPCNRRWCIWHLMKLILGLLSVVAFHNDTCFR